MAAIIIKRCPHCNVPLVVNVDVKVSEDMVTLEWVDVQEVGPGGLQKHPSPNSSNEE